MDVLLALNRQLDFIKWFYCTAEPPFKVLLRTHMDDVESKKWQEAQKGLEVLGQCNLGLVAKAIHDYLQAFVQLEHPGNFPKKGKESWFDYYCRFLEVHTKFRWAESPVPRDRLEQINLSRNDFMHDPEIDSNQPRKSRSHSEKHPLSRFDDPLERAILAAMEREAINLDGEQKRPSLTVARCELFRAVDDAKNFCEFVETHKTQSREQS
jgi:hypothetical protein